MHLPSRLEPLPEGSSSTATMGGAAGPLALSTSTSLSITKAVTSPRSRHDHRSASLFEDVAAPGEAPLLSGLVYKKGGSFPFSWALRYCTVYASSRTMVYYSSQQEAMERTELPRGKKELRA